MSYQKHRIKHIRGTILDFLQIQPQSDAVLLLALEDMALAIPRDQLCGVLSWLEQAGMIEIKNGEGYIIASITQAGFDIAKTRGRNSEIIMPGGIS